MNEYRADISLIDDSFLLLPLYFSWVVVIPCDHRNPLNPSKFELAVYPDLQVFFNGIFWRS